MPYSHFKTEPNSSRLRLLVGVVFFSFLAGDINTSSIILGATAVSHITGNISHLGEFIMNASWDQAVFISKLLLFFLIGTIVSGSLLVGQEFSVKRKYGIVTILEGIVILIAAKIGANNMTLAEQFASLAMGMQNAMMSSYRGMIIRTTHMTGILTDIGFMIGSRMSGRPIDGFKLGLLSLILFTFFAGCCAGYILTLHFGIKHFQINGILCLIAGMVYFIRPHTDTVKKTD